MLTPRRRRRREAPLGSLAADVRPIDDVLLRAPTADERSDLVVGLLNRSLRFQLGQWWPDRLGDQDIDEWEPAFDPDNPELGIRPVTSVALGLATALATEVFDPEVATFTPEHAHRVTTALLDGVARTHLTIRPSGWGRSWQSPMWAAYAGLAAWLVWDSLDPRTRLRVGHVVTDEADRLLSWPIPHYRNPDGSVVTPGDSKAEELSWSARVLHLAAAMAPTHRRAAAWRDAAIPLLVAAYVAPQDLGNPRLVNGRPACAWVGGSNVEANGTVTNHDRTHPSYMSYVHHGAAVLHALLAGRPVDEAAVVHLRRLYATLVDRVFESPPHDPPGGTIYRHDSADLYFPQGNDWKANGRVGSLVVDVQADLWELDATASTPAAMFADLHGRGCREMMDRFDDGRTYAGPEEFASEQREQDATERYAQTWLAIVATANGRFELSAAPAADPVNVVPVCPGGTPSA